MAQYIPQMAFMCAKTYVKWFEKVKDAPSDDGIIVTAHDDGYHGGPDPDPAQVRMNSIPHAKGSRAHFLTDAKFQE